MADELNAESAILDIQWLIRRTQGLATLLPVLEKYNSVDDAITNKEQELADLEAKAASLRQDIQDYSKNFEGLKAELASRQADIEDTVTTGMNSALLQVKTFKDEKVSEAQAIIDAKTAEIAKLDKSIISKTKEANELTSQIGQFTSKLDNLKEKLANLKSSI